MNDLPLVGLQMRARDKIDDPVDNTIVAALVSIIIPTLREAANLPMLVAQVAAAMGDRAYEIVIVDDDSRDGTDAVCAALAASVPIRCLTRVAPVDGLGGAVLHGLRAARGDVLVVMDADLQHPPERLPAILAPIDAGVAEFVVGSRAVAGGSMSLEWPWHRRVTSRVAALLARPLAGDLDDVMSGYFALPRAVFERGTHLAPLGFKIGLELLSKCRVTKLVEVPIHFGVRRAGESKLDVREKFRYLEHLSRLYDFRFPRVAPALKFAIVTLAGGLVGLAFFALFDRSSHLALWQCATLAYGVTIGITSLFHARYVRTQRHWLIRPHAWRDFAASAIVELIACAIVARYLDARLDRPTAGELFLVPFALAIVVRYILRKELLLDVRGLRFIPPLPQR